MLEARSGSETSGLAEFLNEKPRVGGVEEVDVAGSAVENGEREVGV